MTTSYFLVLVAVGLKGSCSSSSKLVSPLVTLLTPWLCLLRWSSSRGSRMQDSRRRITWRVRVRVMVWVRVAGEAEGEGEG